MIAQLDAKYIKTRPIKTYVRVVSHLLFEGRPVTTRWRWINPIAASILRLAARFPTVKTNDSPIFILGIGRSGTTILGKILSLHPNVGFLNEPKLLWYLANHSDDVIGSYNRVDSRYRLGKEHVNAEIKEKIQRLYGFYLMLTGATRVVDKYPEMLFRIAYLRAIFPQARFLLIMRDGWDTIHSIARWSEGNETITGGEVHDWWGVNNRKWNLLVEQVVPTLPELAGHYPVISNLTRQIDKAAVEWIATTLESQTLLSKFPDQISLIRYEDLTSNPKKTLAAALDFCDLSDDPKMVYYAQDVLQPASPKSPVTLDPSLQEIFQSKLHQAGYRYQAPRSAHSTV